YRLRRLAAAVGAQLHGDIGGDEITRVGRFVDVSGHANALAQGTFVDALAQRVAERIRRELANKDQSRVVVLGQARTQEGLEKTIPAFGPGDVADSCNDDILLAEAERHPSSDPGHCVDRLRNL